MVKETYSIPPLISGGIMLSYRCTNACRHCLYRSGPHMPDVWMEPPMIERVADALAHERRLSSVHIAGGEPCLRPDLVEAALRIFAKSEIHVEYVETNAAWCDDKTQTVEILGRFKAAGLSAILVSVSMFHNEFVPFRNTKNCIAAAAEVFGDSGVIVYLPQIYSLLMRMPDDGTHTLAEFCRWAGLREFGGELPQLYAVIPSGRAPEALRKCYVPVRADVFRNEHCHDDLKCTTHFHIDRHGNLFTGLCPGIAPADIGNLHPAISDSDCPIFSLLAKKGPYGLMTMAMSKYGYEPEDGYVSKCDLCYKTRKFLREHGDFRELRPSEYYL